ncbi:baseplate J/gp47 family protein [Wukongibacter baidiensis]|uniref:baseplate J/gp47 family protein n=1 Tax=Wukongibacter baidiensis TaxID=1723361 RepID=UPI003D7FE0F0
MKAPIIDDRKFNDLIDEMKDIVPYFTPEWKFTPHNPDVGTALFMVAALQLEETIDLFNRSLDKNFVSFLNYLNINLKPPKPARLPLVFNLSEGAKNSVSLKKGTKVFGRDEENEELVSFETDELVEIMPVKLLKTFYTSGEKDKIVEVDDLSVETPYFDYSVKSLQEHAIYISSESALNCRCPMEFELIFDYAMSDPSIGLEMLANEDYVCWMYYTEDGWKEFDRIHLSKNKIKLLKNNYDSILKNELEDSRWIKGVIREERISYFKDFFIEELYIKANLYGSSKKSTPKKLYLNDKPLEKDECYPFGEFFNHYDSFYISSSDILSKKNAEIEISFDLELIPNKLSNKDKNINWKPIMKTSEINSLEDPIVSIHTVRWYYWNGIAWEKMEIDRKYERIFYHLNKNENVTVRFDCPDDIEPTEISGEVNYHIKVVVERVENYFQTDGKYMTPKIKNLKLSFDYKKKLPRIDKFLAYNNMEGEDLYNRLNANGMLFYPFKDVGYAGNALYLLFDKPIENGCLNLLFLLDKMNNSFIYNKKITVEYSTKNRVRTEWGNLKIQDETMGLTQDGILNISGLRKFEKCKLFGQEGYWIRILFEPEDHAIRYIKGIYINGVWATQQLSISEYIDLSDEVKETYLSNSPIIDMDLWVNELENLGQKEIDDILKSKDIEFKETYDELGLLKELWIKWEKVEGFHHVGPLERVYKIDQLTGKLEFGDDIRGKLPPYDLKNGIHVSYRVGGGAIGNMKVGSVNQLEEPIAFIDSVSNPSRGYGGANAELLGEAIKRGVKTIRHRDRGVTARDIEDIVKEVSSDIYTVKCIKNVNNTMAEERGSLNVVVVLKDKVENGMPYVIKKQIEEYLFSKIPCNLLWKNKVYISDPDILVMNLKISVTAKADYDKIIIKDDIKMNIERFLNYKSGNYGFTGWKIGEIPRESTFYSFLSDIDGVLNIDSINIHLYLVDKLKKQDISMETAMKKENIIILSGDHEIEINAI